MANGGKSMNKPMPSIPKENDVIYLIDLLYPEYMSSLVAQRHSNQLKIYLAMTWNWIPIFVRAFHCLEIQFAC